MVKSKISGQQIEITPFQKRVYNAVKKIPRGRVTTYRILADYVKCGSAQAIGQALRRNPFAPSVPCHRIIATNLTPGGFCGAKAGTALKQKLKLLAKEGVKFKKGHLAIPKLLYRFN